eukprot:CAMPEP_0198298980 /NCGR_PEP_ID=MMETSP1449-20131203/42937_1 /TAXON_ID=420275 /ORGANISM="Attheya septentrionalis, Strain CCMP2084" /LENGTH=367 /DNA_ID=CAMNT_0044000397 /DNA_START=196 /DNA_END=1296 /DNA_ORIENTATION=-
MSVWRNTIRAILGVLGVLFVWHIMFTPPPQIAGEISPKDRSFIAKTPKNINSTSPVARIAILGERNTGTRWMTSELQKCFPSIPVKPRLIRWKHWFQDDIGGYNAHEKTLVLAQFRDPYEWAEAMRKVPHHSPNHIGYGGDYKMEWKEFVNKPWTMKRRPVRDLNFTNRTVKGSCYEHFSYHELESCVEGSRDDPEYKALFDKTTRLNVLGHPIDSAHDFSAHKPIYELKRDGSGKAFSNLMEMRSAKIYNFVATKDWDWVADTVVVQYERLLREGTEDLIQKFESITKLKRQCTPSPSQHRPKRLIDPGMINWITDNIDWDAEALLGYEKRPYQTEKDYIVYEQALAVQKQVNKTVVRDKSIKRKE